MAEFIFLMHNDAAGDEASWEPYIRRLREAGVFEGGSAIGDGATARKSGRPKPATTHLVGYIRVSARDLDHAKSFLPGNPVYEAGGTVEIRELPEDD